MDVIFLQNQGVRYFSFAYTKIFAVMSSKISFKLFLSDYNNLAKQIMMVSMVPWL